MKEVVMMMAKLTVGVCLLNLCVFIASMVMDMVTLEFVLMFIFGRFI